MQKLGLGNMQKLNRNWGNVQKLSTEQSKIKQLLQTTQQHTHSNNWDEIYLGHVASMPMAKKLFEE